MSLKIYTYSNPYEIENESFWQDIKMSPHFCASQTMVNGLKSIIPTFKTNNNVTTVRNLVNVFFKEWDSIFTKIKQMIDVDNAISSITIAGDNVDGIKKSLINNSKSITNCIRIFTELGLDPNTFVVNNLDINQKILVDIFKEIYNKNNNFVFNHEVNKDTIDLKIIDALKKSIKKEDIDNYEFDCLDFDKVVFNGIHQFNPAVLCLIEELSKYKEVVLLFNYQRQYHEVYSTWLNIYMLFNEHIKFSDNDEFVPSPFYGDSYESNLLADCIGKVTNCEFDKILEKKQYEIIEYENVTEFANYVASIFENAKSELLKQDKPNNGTSALKYMSEQFYSPSSKVNDILRAYFPEQFGERHFLDYPIGHFFVASINMWDPDSDNIKIDSFSDVRECFNSGIFNESSHGLLINSLNKVLPYIENDHYITDIRKKLKDIKKYLKTNTPNKEFAIYYNINEDDLDELINAFDELEKMSKFLFNDYFTDKDNFRCFYERVHQFIENKTQDMSEFDDEMKEVIHELLDRLDTNEFPNSASFVTLKSTMNFFLSQNEYLNTSAKWIVRGFEQIDGDVLLSNGDYYESQYFHFACLSDKDMSPLSSAKLPWPLDLDFFVRVQVPTDQKYQIFIKSKEEYSNFNRFALLYGLEFNKVNYKISYIKNDYSGINDIYYVLKLLGVKIKKYNYYNKSGVNMKCYYKNNINDKKHITSYIQNLDSIDKYGRYRASLCPYRFVLENIVDGKTIYRSRFLIHSFIKTLVKNESLKKMEGQQYNELTLKNVIRSEFINISSIFNISNSVENAEIISSVYEDIRSSNYYIKGGKFKTLSPYDSDMMKKSLYFLKNTKVSDILDDDALILMIETNDLTQKPGEYCTFCSSRDICLSKEDNKR